MQKSASFADNKQNVLPTVSLEETGRAENNRNADRAVSASGEREEASVGEKTKNKGKEKIFSLAYWKRAAKVFKDVRIVAFAAVICALRIAVKSVNVPIAPGVHLSLDCYVNAVGAFVYGPLMALIVGAISDTIGAVLFPQGAYFFPFIFVEMSSGFIFALFLWRKKLSAQKLLLAKFTVNLFCNLFLSPVIQKLYYYLIGAEKAYYLVTGVRVVKNLVLFPLEGILICVLLNALLPGLKALRYVEREQEGIPLQKKEILLCVLLAVLSVALVLFYSFFLKGFIADRNVKWFG